MEFFSTPSKKKRTLSTITSSPRWNGRGHAYFDGSLASATQHKDSNESNIFDLGYDASSESLDNKRKVQRCDYSSNVIEISSKVEVDESEKHLDNNYRSVTKSPSSDRFIPRRDSIDFDFCNHYLTSAAKSPKSDQTVNISSKSSKYYERIASEMVPTKGRRLLPLFESQALSDASSTSFIPNYSNNSDRRIVKKNCERVLPATSSKILDAPNLMDDYYLNLLDWGMNNKIAIALQESLYLWDATDGSIDQLLSLGEESDYVSSVKWSTQNSNILAVGTSTNTVQIWDVTREVMVREMAGHNSRVGSLSWNKDIITSGSRDTTILNHDPRQRRNVISRYCAHQQEVSGLAWSPDGSTLVSYN